MNAAVRAVVRSAEFHKIDCFGIYKGYEGLISDDIKKLNARSVKNIVNKGGTILKSARCLEFKTSEGRLKAKQTLDKYEIDSLVVIGGNGSLEGGKIFEEEHGIKFVGIPGTIDNDLAGTRCSLGYDTALNTATEAIDKIRDTAISHHRLFLVEVMGRDAGFIALNTGLAIGAQEILIPEVNMSSENLINSLKKSKSAGKTSTIIVVAEGDKTGESVFQLANMIEEKLPKYEVRVSVLGHMQRGGSPSCFDRVLGTQMGITAVESLLNGESRVMIGIQNGKINKTDLSKAIKGKSKINKELLRMSKIMNT